MSEIPQEGSFDITLGTHDEAGDYIKLAVNEAPGACVHLSLKQARLLAIALIQHVHRAEVGSKLKRANRKPTQATQERIGAPIFGTPHSQQA